MLLKSCLILPTHDLNVRLPGFSICMHDQGSSLISEAFHLHYNFSHTCLISLQISKYQLQFLQFANMAAFAILTQTSSSLPPLLKINQDQRAPDPPEAITCCFNTRRDCGPLFTKSTAL